MSASAYINAIERMGNEMTQKELEAWVMVLSAIVISGWVWWDATSNGVPADVPGAAWKMVWAIGYVIVFNIIAVIVGVIVVSIVQREVVKDEKADERDRQVVNRSMRNGYFVLSIGVGGVILWQALGLSPELGPYALFAISMLAGATFSASQLVYYRIN
jgi:uncharacterized membrane protein